MNWWKSYNPNLNRFSFFSQSSLVHYIRVIKDTDLKEEKKPLQIVVGKKKLYFSFKSRLHWKFQSMGIGISISVRKKPHNVLWLFGYKIKSLLIIGRVTRRYLYDCITFVWNFNWVLENFFRKNWFLVNKFGSSLIILSPKNPIQYSS
jgi:hypothetical protein